MTKITFIGAGSHIFTRNLARDIMTFPLLQNAKLTLLDTDANRLYFARRSVQRIIKMGNYPTKVEATLNRADALRDADVVLVTIMPHGTDVWRHDIEIPKKYGIDFNVGDTRDVAGIFRALRTIPVMLDIVRDMERYCPDAIMLNYTNPMSMLCRALQRESSIYVTGLCHSVQQTTHMLSQWIGAPLEEITYTCAGINHLAWYTKFEWNGMNAYPLIRKVVSGDPTIYEQEIVRNEMFLHLDYYVTESSGHNSEYNWWFRKRPDLIEKYCLDGTGWNPGEYAYVLNKYLNREQGWKDEAETWLKSETPISLERGNEYAAYIINALQGGEPFEFNGNVPNSGLITNLPDAACVEVPVCVDHEGFKPVFVGALPPQCSALTHLSATVEEMTVEAALTGDPRLVYHAVANSPLTAAVLSLAEIKQMVNEMLEQNQGYLPQFSHFKV